MNVGKYKSEVEDRAFEIRASFPSGYHDDNWMDLILHQEEECTQCDAYRLLQRQEDDNV